MPVRRATCGLDPVGRRPLDGRQRRARGAGPWPRRPACRAAAGPARWRRRGRVRRVAPGARRARARARRPGRGAAGPRPRAAAAPSRRGAHPPPRVVRRSASAASRPRRARRPRLAQLAPQVGVLGLELGELLAVPAPGLLQALGRVVEPGAASRSARSVRSARAAAAVLARRAATRRAVDDVLPSPSGRSRYASAAASTGSAVAGVAASARRLRYAAPGPARADPLPERVVGLERAPAIWSPASRARRAGANVGDPAQRRRHWSGGIRPARRRPARPPGRGPGLGSRPPGSGRRGPVSRPPRSRRRRVRFRPGHELDGVGAPAPAAGHRLDVLVARSRCPRPGGRRRGRSARTPSYAGSGSRRSGSGCRSPPQRQRVRASGRDAVTSCLRVGCVRPGRRSSVFRVARRNCRCPHLASWHMTDSADRRAAPAALGGAAQLRRARAARCAT